MIAMLRILALLSALAATSYALKCKSCTAAADTCTEGELVCEAGQQCGNIYTETSIGDAAPTKSVTRTCLPAAQCNIKGSVTMKDRNIKTATTCCNDVDDCTPAAADYPVIPATTSNLVCRSCSSSTDSCYTEETVTCKSDQDKCLLQTTTTTKGSTITSETYRACATSSICVAGNQTLKVGDATVDIKKFCTNGGLSVHKVVLTPAIVCLLLLKFFI